jgi:hypothetical protein
MRLKKEPEDRLAESVKMAGAATAGATGLKSALNSILSGKAGAVAKMLPKALGRGAGAGGLAMAMSPDDVSPGASEVERKLEAGEPLSEDEALQLQLMKDEAAEGMKRAVDEDADAQRRTQGRREFNKMMMDYETEPTEEELPSYEPVDELEEDTGVSEEDAKQMRVDELLKRIKKFNI